MKSQYIDTLKAGDTVNDTFLLARKSFKEKKDGGSFAVLEFSDRTGSIEGIAWEQAVESVKGVSTDDFVFVNGLVNEYNNKLQITVHALRRTDEVDIASEDFLPISDQDIDKVRTEIDVYRKRIKNEYLKQLINAFFEDTSFTQFFYKAPAAKRIHHAYLGGLAVHTLSMLKLAMHVQTVYPFLNLDLLITGCLLHDIGKIHEYSYTKKIDISSGGRLLGHIMIGHEMVASKIGTIKEFPAKMRNKVLHMIVSHHGRQEWGSPREPMFIEALVLHHIDNLDSKVAMFRNELEKNKGMNRTWSDYNNYFERELFLE